MICAYYSKGCDSRQLFAPYKIAKDESFERNLNKFNVIKIDVNSEYRNALEKNSPVIKITRSIQCEMREQFPELSFFDDDSIADCILKVHSATGERFVIIMDEYDVLVRENMGEKLFTQYLDLLNGLFKSDTLKPAIALAYLTGILPVVRDMRPKQGRMVAQSKLNNFREYTIMNAGALSEFVGFTSDESVDVDVGMYLNTMTDFVMQSAIYLAYIYALESYKIDRKPKYACEKRSFSLRSLATDGFADVVFIPFVPNMPAMIIELKRNGSAESALTQIKQKQYFDSLSAYSGDLLFVGINYDENAKTHECKIEKLAK